VIVPPSGQSTQGSGFPRFTLLNALNTSARKHHLAEACPSPPEVTTSEKGWVMGIIGAPWGRGLLQASGRNPDPETIVLSHRSKNEGLGAARKQIPHPKSGFGMTNREVRSSELGSEGMALRPASSHSSQKFLLVFPHLPDEGLIAGIFVRGGPENHFREYRCEIDSFGSQQVNQLSSVR